MSSLPCRDASVANDISAIQTFGGRAYGGLYIGFLLFIFIAALLTECSETRHSNHPSPTTESIQSTQSTQNKNQSKKAPKAGKCWYCIRRLRKIGREMMRLRSIYFVIVVHIFDTLTDFLIMLEWYIKGHNEKGGIIDCPAINYLGCFYFSVIILLFYRTLSAHYIYKYYQQSQSKASMFAIAQFLDISIFYEVYQSHIHSSQTDNLSYLSKLEKTFESSPQLMLQMYVLIRELSQSDVSISYITIVSIVFSLVSLSTKVIADDHLAFTKEASKKHKSPFLLRAMFRLCEITHRLLAITLFAAFFGANFLFILLFIDLFTNVLLFDHGLLDNDPLNVMSYLLCIMNIGLIPTSKHQLISPSFMNQHPRFETFWHSLFMVMTRLEMITICKLTTKDDHYLSYHLMRSKCIQSLFIFAMITMFALIDSYSSWHFDCFMCTDEDDRNSLYDSNSPHFFIFLSVGYICCVLTYVTYSFSNVFYMKTGMILDRSPWVLFVNFNFFDSIRSFKERNGPNSFKIQSTLQRIIDANARLPTLPRHEYTEDDIIVTYPQLPYLIKEINDNLTPKSVLYELLETAICNLHDNFVDFFLNGYIVQSISQYDPLSYSNPITAHNLLELAITQQNNKIIQTVYLNCPQLLEQDGYRLFYELWRDKYSSTLDRIIDYDFELIRKCNPMTSKSILFTCIDRKLYSILLLLVRNLNKENFDTIKYNQLNAMSYAIKRNDIVVVDAVRHLCDNDQTEIQRLVGSSQQSEESTAGRTKAYLHLYLYVDKIIQTDNTRICRLLMNYFTLDPFTWKSAGDTFIGLCVRYDSVHLLQQLVEIIDEETRLSIKKKYPAQARKSPFFEVKSVAACELLFEMGFSIPEPRRHHTSLLYLKCTTGPMAQRAGIVKWLLYHGATLSDDTSYYKVDMSKKRYIPYYTVLGNACNYQLDLYKCLPILILTCLKRST